MNPELMPDRHPSLVPMCQNLSAMIAAGSPASPVHGDQPAPDGSRVWAPPAFGWAFAAINVGRKDLGADGTRLRLPVRVQWDPALPVLAPGSTATLGWTIDSMGHRRTGHTRVHLDPHGTADRVQEWDEFGVPAQVTLHPAGTGLSDQMTALRSHGNRAKWRLLMGLESDAESALARAHTSLSLEVAEFTGVGGPLLDETRLEVVLTRFLFGEDGHPGKVPQILAKLCEPASLRNVDPWRYLTVAMARDAKEVLRQEVGDSRIGAQVRKMQSTLGFADIDSLVAAFREVNPSSKLSRDRALKALSVGRDPMAGWVSTSAHPHLDPDTDAAPAAVS